MARVQTTVPLKGKISGTTFYTINGVTIATAAHRHVRNPRTEAQMKQRIKLSNILDMYNGIKKFLKNNFEGVVGTKNAASFFRSHNLIQEPVWITERRKMFYQYILAPYTVSFGRMTSIGYTYSDKVFTTDLKIGQWEINAETRVDEFADILVQENPGWAKGDNLKILLMRQNTPMDMTPNIVNPGCSGIEIPMDYSSRKTLGELFLTDVEKLRNDIVLFNNNGFLAVRADLEGTYAFAACHTRGEGTSLMSSPQKLLLSDTTVYDFFRGEEAMTEALKSYKTQGYKNK